MKEKEWKVIPYAPYYKISNYGEVYKFKGEKSPRIMKAKKDKDGYLSLKLRGKNKKVIYLLH